MGDAERQLLGDECTVSPLCDRRRDTDLGKNQKGFFDFICLPFYRALALALPAASAQVEAIEQNLVCWGQERHVAEDGQEFLALRKKELDVDQRAPETLGPHEC